MQSKFTLKRRGLVPGLAVILMTLSFLCTGKMFAQTTISTTGGTNYTGTNSVGAVNSLVTFVVENTNATPIVLSQVDCFLSTLSNGTIPTLWYSSTSLSGQPAVATPAWTQAAIGAPVSVSSNGIIPVLSNLNILIPASTTYRFALQSSLGLNYSGTGTGTGVGQPSPNTFSAGGVNLKLGNFQIAAANVGYAGAFASPTFNARFFTGKISFFAAMACSGTPAPGNTQSTATSACPSTVFTLATQIPPGTTGLTYQWQTSSDGTTWTNAGGSSTNPTYTTTQTTATWYRCNVTCSGNTAASTPIQVNMNLPANCYCAAGATSTSFEKISNFTFGSINNNSAATAGYENFTSISTIAYKGVTQPVSITLSSGFPSDQAYVWIDFNQDGDFGDAGEQVFTSSVSVGPYNGTITIPATALTGPTRLRVRMQDTDLFSAPNNNTPCGNSTYGQVEDYTVDIQPCIPASITSAPQNTSTNCSGNASFNVAAEGTLVTYNWQYRVNSSSPWLAVPAGAPFFGNNTSQLVIRDVPSTMNGYQFRAAVQGGCSATDVTSPATLTVTPLVATVSPASAAICIGSIQALTLTNPTSVAVYSSPTALPLTIADADPAGNASVINVSGVPPGAVATNVTVKFSMTHTWVGDMVISLKAPNGQVINLVGALDNGNGSNNTENFLNTEISSTGSTVLSGAPAPRTGTFKADAYHPITVPLTAPTTTNSWAPLLTTLNGDWSLVSCDLGAGDIGVLSNWSINITYTAPPALGVWTASPASPNTMFTDAAATIPYVPGTPANKIWVKPDANTNYSVVYSTPTPCVSGPTVIPVTVVSGVTNVVNPQNKSACVDGSASFSVSADGGPVTYQWQRSTDGGLTYSDIAGAIGAQLTVNGISLAMSGYRYRCILTAAPCAGSVTSAAAVLTVNDLPVVTLSSPDLLVTPGQTTSVTASSTPAAAAGGWVWNYNGSTIAGNTTNTVSGITIDQTGTYHATVTDVNGCTNTSNDIVIGSEGSDRLWIYPNPTTGAFQVRLYYDPSTVSEKRAVYIYNAQGQLMTSREFDLVNTSAPYMRMDFDLGRAASGNYVVKVVNKYSGKITSGLVVVQ